MYNIIKTKQMIRTLVFALRFLQQTNTITQRVTIAVVTVSMFFTSMSRKQTSIIYCQKSLVSSMDYYAKLRASV